MKITEEVKELATQLIVERTEGGYTEPGARRLVDTHILALTAIHDAIEQLQAEVFA